MSETRLPRLSFLILKIKGETNGSNFEVYAAIGEVYGSGCPLAFLMVQSKPGKKADKEGAKQRYIEELLDHLNSRWDLQPITIRDRTGQKSKSPYHENKLTHLQEEILIL